MGRRRDPKRDKAFELWRKHNGDIPLVDIANQLQVSEGTVRGWKSKDEWNNGTVKERNASKNTERSKKQTECSKTEQRVESEGLTDKQSLFVKEYLIDLNATQAAIRAGYSKKNAGKIAWDLLEKNRIQSAIQEGKRKREERIELTQEWVLSNLKEVAERCLEAIPVLDREGNPIGEWRFEHSGANKSLELIGKHLGMFQTDIKVKHSGEVTHNHEQHYHITQEIIEQSPDLINRIFGRDNRRGVEDRSSPSELNRI